MRLPRVRFSVGKMLFAVAVVAGNCGALRLFYDAAQEPHDGDTRSLVSFTACFLPLINVASIGTFLYMANRLRSPRCKDGTIPKRSPAGVTYFSLHFLFLGLVVCVLTPDLIETYLRLEPLSIISTRLWYEWSWLPLVNRPGVLDVLFECLVDASFIWAPLLLFAWIGGVLAKRYARYQ